MDLPIVKDTDDMGDYGVGLVTNAVQQTGHIFRPTEKRDFGIDGQIEIVIQGSEKRHATGRLIAIQIKCGPSYLKNDIGDYYVHYCSTAHANYWESCSLPVILVLCNPDGGQCYWTVVNRESLSRTREGAKVMVPKSSHLNASKVVLAEIGQAGKVKQVSAPARIFVFPLNQEYGLNLNEDELGILCGEASLAFSRGENVQIEINFEIESLIANEADVIRSNSNQTIEQRKRLIDLETMNQWCTEKREWLAKGIQILLKEDFIRSGYININDFSAASSAIRSFVHYYIFERMGQERSSALVLDTFPNDCCNGLAAQIYLDDQDRITFLSKIDAKGSTEPLKWSSYMLGDLGKDLMLRRGLPAVVTSILFYLNKNSLDENDFFSNVVEPLGVWRLGLA